MFSNIPLPPSNPFFSWKGNRIELHLWLPPLPPPHLPIILGPWLLMHVEDWRPVFTSNFFIIPALTVLLVRGVPPHDHDQSLQPPPASKLRCNLKRLAKFVCSHPFASYPSLFYPSLTNTCSNPHLLCDPSPFPLKFPNETLQYFHPSHKISTHPKARRKLLRQRAPNIWK